MTTPDFSRLGDEGIRTSELSLAKSDGGYRLSVEGVTYENLSAADLRARLREHPAAVREWIFWYETAPEAPARWTFLRWLEDADARPPTERREALSDSVHQTWGQLHLTVRLDEEGERRYAVRHVDDTGKPAERLDPYSDPLDARWLAKYDDNDRYRPLSTAPTLQTGWRFTGLDAAAAVHTVDFFYPATVANWYRERTDELDVTHWREATDRQTGIYSVTGELEGRPVDWVAEACCVDSQCLKRRQWDESDDRTLAVPRGEGTFPCREPCSLVIAAARTWALLEREEERTYTLRLTPSEKEQLERVLAAVAEGTVGEVREADLRDGANRYRARFLRAKRADEEGRLGDASDDGER